eukprot:g15746.t1
MAATARPRRPMLTASLALQLLESAAQGIGNTDCSSPSATFNSSGRSSESSTSTAVTQRKIESLQRALCEATAAASPPAHGPSPYATDSSLISLMNASRNDHTAEPVRAAVSTSSSDDYSLGSWDETEVDEDEDELDRGRLGAAATALSRLSRDESLQYHEEEVAYGAGIRRQFSDERNDSTALDEFDDPALAGAAAALHGYLVSEGDAVFLEKAYEIARGVAGSKHSLTVAFDACRMALAVGYVHTLTKGAPDMANTFAKQHSLCKLANSLKPYWSRSAPSTPEAEVEWEECMSSLLEVASSVALITGDRDVLSVLDIETYSGVTEMASFRMIQRGAFHIGVRLHWNSTIGTFRQQQHKHQHQRQQTIGFSTAVKKIAAIVMGAPGSGKGTISGKILRDFDFTHISTGDLLRVEIQVGSEMGKTAKAFMDQGKFVPDQIIFEVLVAAVERAKGQGKHILLDGFPRSTAQAIALKEHLPVDMVMNLDVPRQVIVDRLTDRWIHPGSGRVYAYSYRPPKEHGKDDVTGETLVRRDDDQPEVVEQRLAKYEKTTRPLLDLYSNENLLHSFSGEESDVIYRDVHKFLSNTLPKGKPTAG